MTRRVTPSVNNCAWCGEPDTEAFHGCVRDGTYRRRAGWPPISAGERSGGTARTITLTPAGWRAAGYEQGADGRWHKEHR